MMRYEFAKSLGAIHAHGIGSSNSALDKEIADALAKNTLATIAATGYGVDCEP